MMHFDPLARISLKIAVFLLLMGCAEKPSTVQEDTLNLEQQSQVSLMILGVMQDGGRPHMGCNKACCVDHNLGLKPREGVVSLGLFDRQFEQSYLFEATPDLTQQWQNMQSVFPVDSARAMDGIFLTHAHIGHYTGLALLGKEVMATNDVPVYAMPKMRAFLSQNGPWNQLIEQNNIQLMPIDHKKPLFLTPNLQVTPFLVPHRDEYSETVGFRISGPNKSALFIPDIDKWHRWDQSIVELIKSVDYAFVDATFFNGDELPNRDMNQVPHPFVVESMTLFQNLSKQDKAKVHFIHFNHTNPIADPTSAASKSVLQAGFKRAQVGAVFSM